ncbi:MAG: phosphoribosylglycinamide formyltransferase [Gammaproteobacteria bacterium]
MPVKMIVSFLASHGGSSARKIIGAIRGGSIPAETGVLITNNPDSAIFRWCQDNEMPVHCINGKTHPEPEAEDLAILRELERVGTDVVVLSGYMKKIRAHTLAAYSGQILNIHPSLLPKHGGHGMYGDRVHQAVLAAGDKFSGASVQIIDEEYDEGPVLAQRRVPVEPSDSVETLRARVQAVEGDLYIEALREFLQSKARQS